MPMTSADRRHHWPFSRAARGIAAAVGLGLAACQSQPTLAPPSTSAATSAPTPLAARAVATTAQPVRGGTLTFGLDGEPLTYDPHAATVVFSFDVLASVGETLLYLDDHHELKPWLAESWEVSGGGATFTFKLRHDVGFQDGTPFNAAAVKWNLDRIVDPNYKAGQALTFLTGYQGTDVLDEFTARVRFAQPFVPFLELAAAEQLGMLSPTATAGQGEQVNKTPVMSGPYKVDEWVAKDHITVSRWDGYARRAPWSDHDGAGYLERIVFKFIPDQGTRLTTLESGESQAIVVLSPQDVRRLQAESLQVVNTPWGGSAQNLFLNVSRPPTDDLRVRQAIAATVDPQPVMATEFVGRPAIGPLTAVALDDPSLRARKAHDLARANQLLDEAGWVLGSDGIRIKNGQRLALVLNASAGIASGTYQILQGQLREVGIDVSIKTQAPAAYNDDNYRCASNGTFNSLRTGGVDVLFQLFHSSRIGGPFNFSCLSDAGVDQALEQGRQEIDPTRRKQVYLQLEHKLLDLAAAVPLDDLINTFGLRPNVTGLRFNGFGYPILSDVWLTS